MAVTLQKSFGDVDQTVKLPAQNVPVWYRTQVLVVGGGASGLAAAVIRTETCAISTKSLSMTEAE